MADFIILAILAVIIGFAARYVYKSRKSGHKCIGCPDGCNCGCAEGGCSGCSGCSSQEN